MISCYMITCNTVRMCWGQYGIQTPSARKSALPWAATANGEQLFLKALEEGERGTALMWGALVSKTAYEEGSVEDGELFRL